jgi:hypothetical protein
MLAALWCAAVVGLLAWVTVTGTDRWPFSAYPMFSQQVDPATAIVVHRLAVVQADGTRRWWRTGDPADQRDLGRDFAALAGDDVRAGLVSAEGWAWMARVTALARHELGADARAVVVVRRRVDRGVAAVEDVEVVRWALAGAGHPVTAGDGG